MPVSLFYWEAAREIIFPKERPSRAPLCLAGQNRLTNPFPEQSLADGIRTTVDFNQTWFVPRGWRRPSFLGLTAHPWEIWCSLSQKIRLAVE